MIDGPKLFKFFDDTLGTARTPYSAHYVYATRPCIVSVDDSNNLFGFFEHSKEGKENAAFVSIDEEHVRCRRIITEWCNPIGLCGEDTKKLDKLGPYTPEFKKDQTAVAAYYKSIFEKKHLLTWALTGDVCK